MKHLPIALLALAACTASAVEDPPPGCCDGVTLTPRAAGGCWVDFDGAWPETCEVSAAGCEAYCVELEVPR